MHESPKLVPLVQVFTHMAPAPNAATQGAGPEGHATLPQVTADGHGHGPLSGYAKPFNASTTATMSKAITSAFNSGRFG